MTDLDKLIARVTARGDWRIAPERPGYHVAWWPTGQGPGYSGPGNPFCQVDVTGSTLEECFARLEELTRPGWRSIEDLVFWARYLAETEPDELAARRRRYKRRTGV